MQLLNRLVKIKSPLLSGVVPAVPILCLTLPSLFWSTHDYSVWRWDPASYGEITLNLFEAQKHGPLASGKAMLLAIGTKPPLLTWLGQAFVPLTPLFGRVEPALLLLNQLCAMATLAAVYATGRRLGVSRLASLAGMAVCGGASLFVGLTNQFFVEPLQMLCVAFLMFLAASFGRMPPVRFGSLLLLAVAASFLVKSSSFTFVLPVLTYLVVACLLSSPRWPHRPRIRIYDLALLGTSVACSSAAVAWYAFNWAPMKVHFVESTNSSVALAYGSVGTVVSKAVFWSRSLAQALSPSPWLLVLVSVAALVALAAAGCMTVYRVHWTRWPGKALDSAFLFGCLVSGTIVVSLYGLSTIINEETRFLAPLIPCVGILTSWALSFLRIRPFSFLVALAASVNAAVAIAYSLGQNPLGIVYSVWLKPYQLDDTQRRRLNLAVEMSCSKPNRIQIIGVDYSFFNANSAAFYSAQQRMTRGYRCFYAPLGYAPTDVAKALAGVDEIDPDYFVTISPDRQAAADVFNQVSLPVTLALLRDPRFQQVPTPDPSLLILARRIQR